MLAGQKTVVRLQQHHESPTVVGFARAIDGAGCEAKQGIVVTIDGKLGVALVSVDEMNVKQDGCIVNHLNFYRLNFNHNANGF